MPKRVTELTVKEIEAAKPGKTLTVSKGLQLVIDTNANKRWVYRYTRPDGRRNRIGLGSYPDVTLAYARKKAQEFNDKLAKGEDPSEVKKDFKRAQKSAQRGTFKALAEEWYAHKAKSWATETARKARETLDDYLFPELASKAIATISTADIKPVLLYVHERGPRLAVKARQYCNQIIDYAIQEGLREDGKLLSLKGALPKAKAVHYAAITKTNDLPSLVKAIKGIDSISSRTALMACLYTASRPGVVAGMRWDELDINAREWHVSAERMKTGNDHISPLPDQLIAMLEALKPLAGKSPFVFPGIRNPLEQHIHRDSLSKVLRENGLRNITVTHGFRATFRTIARERLRAVPDVLEAQLAHAKKDEIQAAYDRAQFLEERHELVQKWADYLDQIQAAGNVVQMTDKVA